MIEFFPIGEDCIEVKAYIAASPQRVYRAWTDPTEFIQWFRGSVKGHLEIHEFDCREGGGYDVTMVNEHGLRANLTGTYLKLSLDSMIEFTWYWKTEEGSTPPMVVTVEFHPRDEGTLLLIRHQPFMSIEDRDAHRSGWEPCLTNLVGYLEHECIVGHGGN